MNSIQFACMLERFDDDYSNDVATFDINKQTSTKLGVMLLLCCLKTSDNVYGVNG